MIVSPLVVGVILVVSGGCTEPPPTPTVTTCDGIVVGKYMESREGRRVAAFTGIPFAKPPTGDMRFEPPQAPEPWSGVLDATTLPPHCIQPYMTYHSEDCLYLNVYRPKDYVGPPLPVMFWVHGGEFVTGGGEMYNPMYFMDVDIVYVSVNYRLGIFGYLSTGDEVVPGNMGLKDIRLALRWVRSNIHHFGGNRERVTIFGESAGAVSVHYLMSFLADEDLFQAAICQSGSSLTPWALRPPEQARNQLQGLAIQSGCPGDSRGIVECLKQKDASELLALTSGQDLEGGFDLVPKMTPVIEPACVADRIVFDNPWKVCTNIPWIVGVNSVEALDYLTEAANDESGSKFREVDLTFDEKLLLFGNYEYSSANGSSVPAAVRRTYLSNLPVSRDTLLPTAQVLSDVYFIYPSYEAAMRANKRRTFFYHYDYVGTHTLTPIIPTARVGAIHFDEVFMFFPIAEMSLVGSELQLSKSLVKLWTNFATYLDPTPCSPGGLDWRPFANEENYLAITQTGLEMRNHFLKDRMTFWREQPFPYRDDDFC